jgi:hypothetical protein
MAATMIDSKQQWDTALLQLTNPETGYPSCPGTTARGHQRCRVKVARARLEQVVARLTELSRVDIARTAVSPDLTNIAKLTLCSRHEDQHENVRNQWSQSLTVSMNQARRVDKVKRRIIIQNKTSQHPNTNPALQGLTKGSQLLDDPNDPFDSKRSVVAPNSRSEVFMVHRDRLLALRKTESSTPRRLLARTAMDRLEEVKQVELYFQHWERKYQAAATTQPLTLVGSQYSPSQHQLSASPPPLSRLGSRRLRVPRFKPKRCVSPTPSQVTTLRKPKANRDLGHIKDRVDRAGIMLRRLRKYISIEKCNAKTEEFNGLVETWTMIWSGSMPLGAGGRILVEGANSLIADLKPTWRSVYKDWDDSDGDEERSVKTKLRNKESKVGITRLPPDEVIETWSDDKIAQEHQKLSVALEEFRRKSQEMQSSLARRNCLATPKKPTIYD